MTQYICESCGVVVRAGVEYPPQHCGDFMTVTEIPEAVVGESEYHHLVYHAVREEGPVMGCEVIYELECSPGTVYPRLTELEEMGVIESRPVPEYANDGTLWATDAEEHDDHSPEEYKPLA